MVVLVWNVLAHLAGIYLFTRGFLLTRLSLPNVSEPVHFPAHEPDPVRLNASSLQTHTSAIVLLIDALRFDFISPHPPHPPSPHHHNVLTLPRDLSATRPRHSLIFDAYSDPPTTTLQRIKALMTGTLPTFVDIGATLGPADNATEVAEDSILKQMNILGKKIAFMGDDTWLSVYPSSFTRNMSFPCESFNVEDLHTVDNAVVSHLFPLLDDPQSLPSFDFLVAHFLGVDHVGHRLGPDHPAMRQKLHQMNDVLKRVVDRMHPSTLLVVLGDHGMDSSGDHGGDGPLETSSAMWFYSKGPALINSTLALPDQFLTYQSFPGSRVPHRSIQQIDIVPSLSLLLGLPIPYNNVGTVIPELFWRDRQGKMLQRALEANARQLWRFLRTYRESSLGGELDDVWEGLFEEWEGVTAMMTATAKPPPPPPRELSLALLSSTRRALAACRAIWAQFNALLMALGLCSLATCLIACWRTLLLYPAHPRHVLRSSFFCSVVAASLGGGLAHVVGLAMRTGVSLAHWIMFFGLVGSSFGLILLPATTITTRKTTTSTTSPSLLFSGFPIILALHSLTFVSNSFTFWEDRLLPFFMLSSLVPYLRLALLLPHPTGGDEKGIRTRLLIHLGLFALSVRLMAVSTVCREEQQPYCGVTFFQAGFGPPWIVVLVLGLGVLLGGAWWVGVGVVRAVVVGGCFGGWQEEEEGEEEHVKLTRIHRRYVVVPTLMAGTLFWLIEWMESVGLFVVVSSGDDASLSSLSSVLGMVVSFLDRSLGGIRSEDLRTWRTCVAWFGVGWCVVGACVGWIWCWSSSPSWGSGRQRWRTPYTILWTTFFGLTYMCTQLTGQVVLLLCAVAIVSFGEVIGCVLVARKRRRRADDDDDGDSEDLQHEVLQHIKFTDMTPLALLSLVTFYATGHQATVPSIQWKPAFMLCAKVQYPSSAITMLLNEFGGIGVVVLGVGEVFFGLVEGDEKEKKKQKRPAVVKALLSLSTHFLVLLLGSSVGTAILRRHLMVWKVFTPRLMMAVLQVLVVDLVALVVALFA